MPVLSVCRNGTSLPMRKNDFGHLELGGRFEYGSPSAASPSLQ